MDDFKPELLKALLDWVNTFDLPYRITTLSQLEDGQILWQILADIDSDYFNESLPNFEETHRRQSKTDNWIPRWQNLKHIERATSMYIREECEQLPVLTKRMIPDLKTGARDGSTMLVAKLTMAVLLAACFSPRSNQRMLQVMPKLGTKTAETIAEAIQEMQALDQRMSELGVDAELTAEPSLTGYRTPTRTLSGAPSPPGNELEQEAQLFEANKDRQALKVQVGKLSEELKVSRERIAKLEEEVAEASAYLDVRAGQAQRAESDDVENLRNDLLRDRQYIDQLEQDLANARDIMDSQKRRLDRLQGEEGSKQELRDQLQLIKAERDELSQKAKANENLKKKIESLTKETKQLETLREDYQQARERLAQLESVEERNEVLQNIIKENGQTLANGEQAIFEEKGKRTRVEHENLLLMKQLEQTRELQYKAEDAKQELEERIRELESSNHADRGDSLEDELSQDENNQESDTKPVSDGRVSADAIALQQRVDILNARLKSLESETLKQMQENLGLRSDMMMEKDETSQKPFLEQNEKLQTAQSELEELRRRLREQDLKMAELRNELNRKSDVADDVRIANIQKEHERLLVLQERTNDRLRELELANAEKSSLLRAALLDRENLPAELLELKRVETIRQMRERIETVIKAPAEVQPNVLDSTSSEIAETVLSAEVALDKAKKVSSAQISHSKSSSSAFDAAISTMRRHQLEPSFTATTLVSPASPHKRYPGKNKSLSELSTSTAGTGQTTWGRITQLVSPKRRPESATCGTEYLTTTRTLSDRVTATNTLQQQDLQDQVEANGTLREQLELATKESAEKGSVELQLEVENLRRENALVKSMWYDMNQRLMSNTVILQRRSEAPKGWLGKQRAAVGGGASVLVR
ncbi:HOOK multi-domain protein [Pyrenophora teres f. teres]|uniref:HOOK multi-domain protein n=1 Tax=Pyrenophora teres f. teres TaxID=97479 RepID=A0A6S6WI81_9PLEO|nr:HOOK multi-domain protein [Pyrenophora teres f. teres]